MRARRPWFDKLSDQAPNRMVARKNAPGRNRTYDLALRRRALYPLSYRRGRRSVPPVATLPGVEALVRYRKLIVWLVMACAATAGGVAFAVTHISPPPTPRESAPTARSASEPPAIAAADRRQIDGTLDAFLASAVERRDPGASFALATPALRAGKTRAQWAAGHIPVMPYQAANPDAHDYRITYVNGGQLGLELLLHPAPGYDMGAIAFSVRMKRLGGRWLVDTFYPNAVFAKEGEGSNIRAVPDLGPLAGTRVQERADRSTLWIVFPLAVLGLPLLGALAFFALSFVRSARRRRSPPEERVLVDWGSLRDSQGNARRRGE
jgi:hypothetical protein